MSSRTSVERFSLYPALVVGATVRTSINTVGIVEGFYRETHPDCVGDYIIVRDLKTAARTDFLVSQCSVIKPPLEPTRALNSIRGVPTDLVCNKRTEERGQVLGYRFWRRGGRRIKMADVRIDTGGGWKFVVWTASNCDVLVGKQVLAFR